MAGDCSYAHLTGPFWDGVNGRAPIPRAARSLHLEFVGADLEAGTIELAFDAPEDWTNPNGNVLGAFVAAMLYDTLGPALLASLAPDEFQSTTEISVHFLRAVRPGRLTGRGRISHRRGDLAHLEGELLAADGTLLATATASAIVVPREIAREHP